LSTESKLLTGVLVAVVAGMIGLFVLANKPTNSGPAPVGDKTKVVRDSSHKEGSGSVQFVEFGDFQCPACGAAEPNVEQAMKEFNGKVTFYFRNFPLTTLHQNAMTAAQAAEAAGDQGKYWEMHDKLYQTQKEWETLSDPTDKFTEYAKGLGLDGDKFKQAVQDEKFKSSSKTWPMATRSTSTPRPPSLSMAPRSPAAMITPTCVTSCRPLSARPLPLPPPLPPSSICNKIAKSV
jgi:hypothetical protein